MAKQYTTSRHVTQAEQGNMLEQRTDAMLVVCVCVCMCDRNDGGGKRRALD